MSEDVVSLLLGLNNQPLPCFDLKSDSYRLQMTAFELYGKRYHYNKEKPYIDYMFFRFFYTYNRDILRHLAFVMFEQGQSVLALAKVNKTMYDTLKGVIMQCELRRIIMDDRVWLRRQRPNTFFYLHPTNLFLNMRQIFKLKPCFSDLAGETLEDFIWHHLRSEIDFVGKNIVNLRLFPEDSWEIKPKNNRSKKKLKEYWHRLLSWLKNLLTKELEISK
eukprot:TRINITY_DN1289_c0_g1_i5.p1 TRINITY_DN1289_c0_g1~~TRINITY_DN1289_c0_g1_i5.p1  ORF type:complete len:219 (+),score=14.71 TRINITY_DN1289_c0_g1_i5:1-657(+)